MRGPCGAINTDDTIDDKEGSGGREKKRLIPIERESSLGSVAWETLYCIVLYSRYPRIPIKHLFVARPVFHRGDKEKKGPSIRLRFSTGDDDTDDDDNGELPSQRCSLTAFFPVSSARRAPALSARMEIRSALFVPLLARPLACLPPSHPEARASRD